MSDYEWIDETFRVEESRWKTWKSYDKDGNSLVTSLTKESCISATRFYLKVKQEEIVDNSVTYSGQVDYKL